MKWFRSPRVVALEAEVRLLEKRLEDEKRIRLAAADRESYWRVRYERLADAVMFKQGEIAAPVHVEPGPLETKSVLARVGRMANMIGRDGGFKSGGANG